MGDKKLVPAIIGIVLVLIGGYFLVKRAGIKPFSTGKVSITEASPTPEVSPQTLTTRPQVKLQTSKGEITFELRPDLAPQSVANFLAKFTSGGCAGLTFHRIEDWVVQGCDPAGDGTGGQNSLPTETSGEAFVTGAVGVARRTEPKDKSNDSQFFVVKKDSPFLNGEYTYLGKVIAGMDVVNRLAIGDKILSTLTLTK